MSDNIDTLVTDIKSLPILSDYGPVNSTTVEILPQRQVGSKNPAATKDNWSRGLIDTQFSVNSGKRCIMSQSYFKSTVALTVDGAQPTASSNIALASNFMNNLISSCAFYIGNVCVSRCEDYCGQTSMVKYRQKDLNWLSTIGRDIYYIIPSFQERQRQTNSDGSLKKLTHLQIGYDDSDILTSAGNDLTFTVGSGPALPDLASAWSVGDRINYISGGNAFSGLITVVDGGTQTLTLDEPAATLAGVTLVVAKVVRERDYQTPVGNLTGKNIVQIMFQLPLGIFDDHQTVLPAGDFRFKIFPKNDKISGVETGLGAPLPSTYFLNIIDFKLVLRIFDSSKNFADDDYYLSLEEWSTQNRKLNPGSSLTTHNFTVDSTCTKIIVFAQDTESSSPEAPNIPPSVFRSNAIDVSEDVRHMQITFASVTKPATLFDSKFGGLTQNVAQRYLWNAQNLHLEDCGGELLESWLEGGPMYSFEFVRPEGDDSTQMQLQIDYGNMSDSCELFICTNKRNIVKVSTENGLIKNVLISEH